MGNCTRELGEVRPAAQARKLRAQLPLWSSWGRKTAVGCRQVLGKKIAGCLGTSGIVKTSHPRNQDSLPSAERGEDLGGERRL